MPRRNSNAKKGGRAHSKGSGRGWMHKAKPKKQNGDRAPLTPGAMHLENPGPLRR